MATVKKKIVKACKGVSYPKPSSVSANLKRGGTVKKAQFGKTTPAGSCAVGKDCAKADAADVKKAERLSSMSDARRERVEGRMARREERKANREDRRNTPSTNRWGERSRGPRFGGFKTGGTVKKSTVKKAQVGIKEKMKAAESAPRVKDYQRNTRSGNLEIRSGGKSLELNMPFEDWKKIPSSTPISKEQFNQAAKQGSFKGINPAQKNRMSVADSLENDAVRSGGRYQKNGGKIAKKVVSKMIKKSAVKKAVVKKTIKSKSKKK
jgi:hypothetical protein